MLAQQAKTATPTTTTPVVTPATEPKIPVEHELGERVPNDGRWVRRKPAKSDGQTASGKPSLESYVELLPQFEDRRGPEDIEVREVKPWAVVTPEPPNEPALLNSSVVSKSYDSDERQSNPSLDNALATDDDNPFLEIYNEVLASDIEPPQLVKQTSELFKGIDPIEGSGDDSNWFPPIFEEPQIEAQYVQAVPKTREELMEEAIASVITLNNVMPIDNGIAVSEVSRYVEDLYAYRSMSAQSGTMPTETPPVIAALAGNEDGPAASSMAWTNWLWLPLMAGPLVMLVRRKSRSAQQRFAQEKRAETMAASEAENTAVAKIRKSARRPRPVEVVAGELKPQGEAEKLLNPSQSLIAGAGESLGENSDEYYSPADEALLAASFDTQVDWNQPDDFTIIPGIDTKVHNVLREYGVMSFGELATLERKALEELKERLADQYSILEIAHWCQAAREHLSKPKSDRVFQVEEADFGGMVMEDLASVQSMASTLRASDDLTDIDGVDSRIQTLLNSFGIERFTDLATAERTTLTKIADAESSNGVTIEHVIGWCKQARELDAANLPVTESAENRI
ncbi:MAG: hypothetical protein AAF497_20960, partial [Planctomycetota bacterium]